MPATSLPASHGDPTGRSPANVYGPANTSSSQLEGHPAGDRSGHRLDPEAASALVRARRSGHADDVVSWPPWSNFVLVTTGPDHPVMLLRSSDGLAHAWSIERFVDARLLSAAKLHSNSPP